MRCAPSSNARSKVPTVDGTAESIPLGAASFDAVVAA
jgi:hypothetical protein